MRLIIPNVLQILKVDLILNTNNDKNKRRISKGF